MTVRKLRFFLPALAASLAMLNADTLVLRDGSEIDGTLLSATSRQIEFLPTSGKAVKIPVDQVASMSISEPPVVAAPQAQRHEPIIIPGGTRFRVRTIDNIDVDATQAGMQFRGSVDDPIMLGGDVIVPRGAPVVLVASKVEQGGRFKGSDLVQLKVDSITVGGLAYPVVTSAVETKSSGEGKKTAGKVLGGTGLGAIIGGIAGGGKGAAIGALAGAAGGTILSATGQPHLKIPSETRLEFQLGADWKVQ